MKMKDQLDSAQPLKKHKAKHKKADVKKKKQAKLEAKKQSKDKKKSSKQTSKPLSNDKIKAVEQETVAAPSPVPAATPVIKTTNRASSVRGTTTPRADRQRVSKGLAPMSKTEQSAAIKQVIKRMLLGNLSQGAALRELRVKVLGLRQEAYTELTGVSRKTLSEIENNKGNYTPEIINKVFAPFHLKVSLVPTSSRVLKDLLNP